MSLFWATLLSGLVLILIGGSYCWKGPQLKAWSIAWPRSSKAVLLLFGPAALWFLWHILSLSKADFGDYKWLLFVAFSGVAVGAYRLVPDFLAVRGLAILMLLTARPLLDATYMQFEVPQRLVLVMITYLGIVLALWLGASPFRMRDFYSWLYAQDKRSRWVGASVAAYGVLLLFTSLTY